MRRIGFAGVLVIALLAVGLGTFALAAESTTVEGEVIDQGCFMRNEAHGADHQECAARCLRNGNPAGILTEEGAVFTLAASASAFESFAAKRVRVNGKTVDNTVFPESMEVWENEAWVNVPLTKFGSPETK